MRRLGGIALLIPLLSALTSPAVPIGFRLLLAALWTGAIVRPHWALAGLALIVPFASWLLLALDAPPVRFAEALVLATLSGGLIAAARPRRTPLEGQSPGVGAPALVFAAVTIASAGVMLAVMQAGTHSPWPFIGSFVIYLTRDYLIGPPGSFAGVTAAALLVEGLGLMFLVARHARDHVVRPSQLVTAIATAGALAATVTLYTFIATALQAPGLREFVARLAFSRMGVHVADVNAAGSFFAMTTFAALACALNRRHARTPRRPGWRRACWIGASMLMLAAVWITGSRMALVATLGGLVLTALLAGALGARAWPRWAVVTVGVCVAGVIVAIALGVDPRPTASRGAARMLSMRADFMVTGVRMMASAPIFGVGAGRYFEMSGQFMPSSIYWFYFHENAHNNFLQIGGELGLAGLAAFVWLLAAAAVRITRGLQADPEDRLLGVAAIGLAAFVATWMTSHPMLVAEVAYPFWMLVGAAVARADGDVQPPLADSGMTAATTVGAVAIAATMRPRGARRFTPATMVVGLVVVALAASIPLRARRQMAATDFGRLSFGFYDWEGGPDLPFRWTTRRATFFVPATARGLQLRLRARHLRTNTAPTQVSIAVGGRTFNHVVLADDNWVDVPMRLPLLAHDDHFQRIDIITEPTWSPAVLFGGQSDVRVLGVQVAEPVVGL